MCSLYKVYWAAIKTEGEVLLPALISKSEFWLMPLFSIWICSWFSQTTSTSFLYLHGGWVTLAPLASIIHKLTLKHPTFPYIGALKQRNVKLFDHMTTYLAYQSLVFVHLTICKHTSSRSYVKFSSTLRLLMGDLLLLETLFQQLTHSISN